MLNEEFLNGLLGKEDVAAEDVVKQILAEHEADTRGLLQKRDELLGSEKKLKEQISVYETGKADYESKITDLEEKLKKASSDDVKKYYETQLSDSEAKHKASLKKVTDERDYYKQSHLKFLRDKAIESGVKELNFVEGLRDGFIARVLSMNDFEYQEIDGQPKFLNKEHHTIEEAINAFALTQEGKAYLRNPSSGGGAKGSGSSYGGGTGTKTMTRDEFTHLQSSNPQKAAEFFKNGGRIV